METGREFELRAARFLRGAGLEILEHNYRCKAGEIDLVCLDGTALVFVEVRFRSRHGFASAAASVTAAKQRRLTAAARHYLQRHGMTERTACRIDVVTFDRAGAAGRRPGQDEIQWIKNAIGS